MSRALSLYLPSWSVDLIRRRARRSRSGVGPHEQWHQGPSVLPVLLVVASHGDRRYVVHGCERAEAAGVRPGMALAHARALVSSAVQVHPLDDAGDARALRGLAQWALRVSPVVAPDPPDGLRLDISGCERLFHGERRLVERLGGAVERLGVRARVASAPTFGCAWAVARFGPCTRAVVAEGAVRRVLGRLPLAALRLGQEAQAALAEVGIGCVGELLELPRAALAARFGVGLLLRLDQATGRAVEPIVAVRPECPIQVERLFAGPVCQLEAIVRTVRELAGELAAELASREAGATEVVAELVRLDADPVRLSVVLSRPSRDAKHLGALLCPQVERANLGHGVERIGLSAARVGSLPHRQADYLGGIEAEGADGAALGRLLDVLAGRLGAERVARIEPTETHVPERVFRRRPAVEGPVPRTSAARLVDEDRPAMLFDPPRSIQAIAPTPDGPPSWLRWGRCECRIIASSGPHRIAGPWWRAAECAAAAERVDLSVRDYFKVADERGHWLWVYREQASGCWFLHGQWI